MTKKELLKKWILGDDGLTNEYENIDAIWERLPAEVKSRFTNREFRKQMTKTKQIKNPYIERQPKEKKNDPMFYRLKEQAQLQPEVTKAWILENLTTNFIKTQDLFAAVPPNIKAVLAIPRRGQPAATQALRDKKARAQFMRILKSIENLQTEKRGYRKFWRLEPEAEEDEAEAGDAEAEADEEPFQLAEVEHFGDDELAEDGYLAKLQPQPVPPQPEGEQQSVMERARAFEDNIVRTLLAYEDNTGKPGEQEITESDFATAAEILPFLQIAFKRGSLELAPQTKGGSENPRVRLAKQVEGAAPAPQPAPQARLQPSTPAHAPLAP